MTTSRTSISGPRRGILLAVLVAVALAGAGCTSPPRATASDIVGQWSGHDGARITFRADHTASAESLPLNLQSPDRYGAPWSGSASWSFKPARPGEFQTIYLSLRPDGTDAPMYVGGDDDKHRLFLWIGDPDEGRRVWFDKTP